MHNLERNNNQLQLGNRVQPTDKNIIVEYIIDQSNYRIIKMKKASL